MIVLRIAALLFLVAWVVFTVREIRSGAYLSQSIFYGLYSAVTWGSVVAVFAVMLGIAFGVEP